MAQVAAIAIATPDIVTPASTKGLRAAWAIGGCGLPLTNTLFARQHEPVLRDDPDVGQRLWLLSATGCWACCCGGLRAHAAAVGGLRCTRAQQFAGLGVLLLGHG